MRGLKSMRRITIRRKEVITNEDGKEIVRNGTFYVLVNGGVPFNHRMVTCER